MAFFHVNSNSFIKKWLQKASFAVAFATCFAMPASAQVLPEAGQATPADPTANVPPSYRGPISAIAAIVDDQVISTFDVSQRVRLMVISSGGRITPEMAGAIEARAIRDLVEERLKLIEAKKWELVPEESDINADLAQMAGQSGLTVDQLTSSLAQNGVAVESLRAQIGAGIVWPQIVQGRFGQRVRVSEEEIDRTMDRMREEAGTEQFLVSEICIPVPAPDQAQAYFQGGLQLIEQMRRGVPFAVVAQQFSACTSAAAGGDLGWVRPGELPPEIDRVIRDLPPGAVSNPIPSEGAFIIMALRDKREAKVQGEKSYTLAYASAPVALGRSAARQALESLASANACGNALREDLGPDVGVAFIENAKLSDIDERFHTAIEGLDRGDLSPVIEADDMLHVAYVCELDEGLGIPSRRSLENRIYQRQLEKISQQYLRDVERRVMVDIRMKPRQQQQQQPQLQ